MRWWIYHFAFWRMQHNPVWFISALYAQNPWHLPMSKCHYAVFALPIWQSSARTGWPDNTMTGPNIIEPGLYRYWGMAGHGIIWPCRPNSLKTFVLKYTSYLKSSALVNEKGLLKLLGLNWVHATGSYDNVQWAEGLIALFPFFFFFWKQILESCWADRS